MGRIEKEKEIITIMIKLYCSKNHRHLKDLCNQCSELLDYSLTRLELCKYGEKKTSCGMCVTPCYKPDMKINIKKVMRFSGPRLLVYRPCEFIRHLWK